MMLRPTIAELTKGEINRYELAIATAKCARAINNEYVKQREAVEKAALAGKEAAAAVSIDPILADTKAVRVAIDRIYEGRYNIVKLSDAPAEEAEATEEAEEQIEE